MKKVMATVAEWFAIVGVLCALVGFFFPPAGMWRLDENGARDWDWLSLGKLMSSDGNALVITAFILMVIALLATVYIAIVYKVSPKPQTGLIMFGVILVSFLLALFVRNALIVNPTNHTYVNSVADMEGSIGVRVLGVAYLLQIVGSFLAMLALVAKTGTMFKIVNWASLFGLLAVIIGFILPFIKRNDNEPTFSGVSFVKSLRNVSEDSRVFLIILLVLLVQSFILFWVAVVMFRSSKSRVPSVLMAACGIEGVFVFGLIMKMITKKAFFYSADIGLSIIWISYGVLIMVAFFALLIDASNKQNHDKPIKVSDKVRNS